MLNSDDVREYKIHVDERIKLSENICPVETIKVSV